MSAYNMSDIPTVFSDVLGLDVEPTAILLTVIGLIVIMTVLSILEINRIGISITSVAYLSFFTYIGWFPIWIMIIIALAVAGLIGIRAREAFTGE